MTKHSHDPDEATHATADTETSPSLYEEGVAEGQVPAVPDETPRHGSEHASTPVIDKPAGPLGSAWIGLVLGSVVTILLLIFVAQNTASTEVHYLGMRFSLPLGVLILFAAIAGALIMALFAAFRILQLRFRARRALRSIS